MHIIHQIGDICSQSVMITIVVIMLMILIEYVNVKTSGKWMFIIRQKSWLQILLAAFLGWIPGCVGIFAVVSLYTHHLLSFGALLAACIATFGDEAFFMFSLMPAQAALMSGILLLMAVVAGIIADCLGGKKNIMPGNADMHFELHAEDEHTHHHDHTVRSGSARWSRWILVGVALLFAVGIAGGFMGHEHVVSDAFAMPVEHGHEHHGLSGENIIFLVLTGITILLLCVANGHFVQEHVVNHVIKKHFLKIFGWILVILALLAVVRTQVSWDSLLHNEAGEYMLLLIAILIGCIPESGPHLIVLFMCLNGMVPFTTLIANSIVQEGHGGLPLLAEKPKDFVWIKLIKIILALAVGIVGLMLK